MRLLALFGLSLALVGCNRNAVEAVNRFNEGNQAKKSGNLEEAASKYDQAAKLDPSNHRILWGLCTIAQQREAWEKVAEHCKNAARASEMDGAKKKAPSFATYYANWGYALRVLASKGQAQWADAKEPLQTAIKIDPNLAGPYADLGEVSLHLDDEAGALQNFTKAIETRPTELGAYVSLAQLYMELGFDKEAEQVLKEGLSFANEVKSDDQRGQRAAFSLRAAYGAYKQEHGDNKGAISEFEAAKKICGQCNERGQSIVYFGLGAALVKDGQKDLGIAELKKFNKVVCKGSAKKNFDYECDQTADIVMRAGGTL